ncbi:baseplate multidomain protein megatron [Methylocystis echinoides]|uniref:Gene transfer agent (GTA) like protein n=1 Tax=Methylocystis echinoides TaxID=29468 RepID=A0A9W6GS77_9HYPH|nr:glycoside hydrolase/phage tail family protein [Methylocystis echinoides]GLI92054.1 hypothetical protein LMG27198_10460 [Methylocystis echinoides]
MAALVLQTVGSAVGGAIGGPLGSTFGRLAGTVGGALIDGGAQSAAAPRISVGPRLKSMDGVTSFEGAGIPRVYGRARIGGQMIWTTRFLERTNVSYDMTQGDSGGKGGGGGGAAASVKTTVSYSYFANLAIALCEGPIAFVRRIWADGVELDLTTLPLRIYRGDETQEPDPLIVAKEEAGQAPAYRGLAYVVFENLPLASFGNRVPQFTFEVVKPVAGVGEMIRAIDLIPGATEAGYLAELKLNFWSAGATSAVNRHQLTAETDWKASLDALQALCPNLRSVALVVAWFGDDLRAGECTIEPRVDSRFKTIGQFNGLMGTNWPADWSVGTIRRETARLVSQIDGRAAYGGTPSDASVLSAIRDLRTRGLSVLFYPFVMMDIPADNQLPDPRSGATGQPAFPWRGRITCDPAPGRDGSPDNTEIAASQIASFATRYRGLILHYANLCRDAGLDAFLIGSEFIGLTRVRSGAGHYPFVSALVSLAAEVKAILGAGTKVSYAADWTEYGAHVPQSGELRFPLDPLWASPSVDFIGVDVYWPLSDWRDGDGHLDAQAATSVHDLDYLTSRVASGEGYDWHYASADARRAQIRTPITDGLGKPWVHRQKDLVSFWSQPHYERVGGVELGQPTAWTPRSKPIWITETGCPAVDRGANAPNVFPDPHSSDGGLPYFSRDGRDDLMQARFVEAMLTHFDPSRPGGDAANPWSSLYGGRMVDPARIYLWCWDARPFPAFPAQTGEWSDGPNWRTGHWLTGRLEGAPLDRLVMALAGAVETPGLAIERPDIGGFVDGYVLDRPMSPRDAIEPLATLHCFDAVVGGGRLTFVDRRRKPVRILTDDDLVAGKDMSLVTLTRAQESELPGEIALTYADSENNGQLARVLSRRLEGRSARQSDAQAAVLLYREAAQKLVDLWLQDIWTGRETAEFSLRPGLVALQPGDIVRLESGRLFQIQRITDGAARRVSARAVDQQVYDAPAARITPAPTTGPRILGPPRIAVLDLAVVRSTQALSYLAAFADPWPGTLAILKIAGGSTQTVGLIEKRAIIGDTLDILPPGPVGRFDQGSSVRVRFAAGELASVDDLTALDGRTAMAIKGGDGAWEIFSFARAELVGENIYRLSRLIRGVGGEEGLAARAAPAGATVVLLNDALTPLARDVSEIGAPITYAIGPADRDVADPLYLRTTLTATGKALMPYAPTQPRAVRNAEGIIISFLRRGRIDADAWQAIDIPLGETSESYEAEIVLPTGRRRLSGATPSILYPAARELADFGAPQSVLSLSLYQMSATVGRGFPFTGMVRVQGAN